VGTLRQPAPPPDARPPRQRGGCRVCRSCTHEAPGLGLAEAQAGRVAASAPPPGQDAGGDRLPTPQTLTLAILANTGRIRQPTPPTMPDTADVSIIASADSPDTADAMPSGARLADLVARSPLSRGSIFELIKALGITTEKGPGPDGKGRVAWLSDADAHQLFDAAQRVHRGEVRIADLASGIAPLTPQTPQTLAPTRSADSADPVDPPPFLARLEAAERAIASGLGLTTDEARWILGVIPDAPIGQSFPRGGILATHAGVNVWHLTRLDPSGDSAQNRVG